MSNRKATKRALLTSVMALVMCVVMLVGTTFAWFTDTASTGVNKIQAGNLDVELAYKNEATNGDFAQVTKGTNVFMENALWEPGHVEYVVLKVSNAGNLALKYKLGINIASETGSTNVYGDAFQLSDYIKFAVIDGDQSTLGRDNLVAKATDSKLIKEGYTDEDHLLKDASKTVTLVVWMPTDVGNEANHKTGEAAPSIDLGISVVATQYTYEKDSFDDQYDKDAEYPATVGTAADLKEALAAGKDVMLTKSIALTEPLSIKNDTTITGNGYAVISDYPVYVAPAAEVTFDGVNFATPVNANGNASSVYASNLEGKVVFDGCTFTNPQWECIQITPKDGAEIVVTNCTFIVDGNGTYAQENGTKVERMLHIQNTAATGDYKVTVTNNKFIGVDKVRNSVIDIDDIAAFGNVICGGNSFANADGTEVTTLSDGLIYVNLNRKYDAASVATGTFAQFTQNPAAALHH